MRHLLSIDDLSIDDIFSIFNLSNKIIKEGGLGPICLSSNILASLFYQPSTRTRLSFEAAAQKLHWGLLSVVGQEYSSIAKGESIADSIRVISESYADVIVLRHNKPWAIQEAAAVSHVPLINAGDGKNEHPTQALVDAFTIWKQFGLLDTLTIAVTGDLKNGRAARSFIKIMKKLGATLKSWAEWGLEPNSDLDIADGQGCTRDIDIVYMTRIQDGRLNKRLLTPYNFPGAFIMHPLPRNNEIPTSFDSHDRALYFKQARNALPIRMALLSWIKKCV